MLDQTLEFWVKRFFSFLSFPNETVKVKLYQYTWLKLLSRGLMIKTLLKKCFYYKGKVNHCYKLCNTNI